MSKNNYLRAIFSLTNNGEGSTKTSEVAAELDVSDASASEAVSKLQEEGLVCKADYKGFTLSPMGKKKGKRMEKVFHELCKFLEANEIEKVEDEANAILDSASISAIEKIVEQK